MTKISEQSVARFSLYRRIMDQLADAGTERIFSRDLAALAGVSPAQVRRDLMATGVSGHTSTGYTVDELACAIGRFLDDPAGMNVALVGVGQLGRSILGYFHGRRDNLPIVAGFDIDPWKYDRRIRGVPCYHLDQLGEVVRRQAIRIGILATPDPAAQPAADALIAAGVQGLLNFTPVALNVPEHVYVEVNDITASLERVAFFARRRKHSTTKALTP